ncbi:transposase [Arthrobacter zhaoguopingii]|uniref:transposase n=1 Tax=Arthrobacter zhaoguopingii TaxID=2681491 RepID=UPI001FE55B8E|nr:transposase [Arthrobacter zhaoguopingii]
MLSLSARGPDTGEIAAHVEEVCGAKVFKDSLGQLTGKVTGELAEGSSRSLDPNDPVRNTAFYVIMKVTVNRERDILGYWVGDGFSGG